MQVKYRLEKVEFEHTWIVMPSHKKVRGFILFGAKSSEHNLTDLSIGRIETSPACSRLHNKSD